MGTEGQGSTSATPTSATATEPKEEEGIKGDKTAVVSGEVCESIKKGMRIISDIEKTRADGMVFKFELDLMYALAGEKATARAPPGLCLASCQRAACNKTEEPTGRPFCCCSKCGAKYCSRECQVIDWKKDHKAMCGQLKEMRGGDAGGGRAPLDRQSVVARVLGRVRLYLCPFAVCHGEALGRGFVFVQQTPNPVLELEYLRPVNSNGRRLDRSIILHFLSMGEFVDAVLQDDFELGVIRSPLEAAVESYDTKAEMVVLFRARCGYMAVVVVPLVPGWAVCRQLGLEYKEKDALQLNLDDTD
ncbi:unnamed protein product [Ectocarpus sp. 6 AP-2014]